MGTRTFAMGVGAYAAAKAALELYTEGLFADLLGTGVTAQLFVPGTTRTEFSNPREGDKGPAWVDPNAMEADAVAAALVAFVRGDDFEGHASDQLARTAATKRSDPNRFLHNIRQKMES
jgi:short-subunit dehydrogenase